VNCRFIFALALLVSLACFADSTALVPAATNAASPTATSTNDPVELEYKKLMEADDAAAEEVDGWILENQKFAEHGGGVPKEELNRRIKERFESVRLGYEDFIKRHPNHGRARLAFASFLEDIGEQEAALEQMLKAKEVEPGNPAAWNNLANYYGHYSPVTNAFAHYEKAIELDPNEPIYYHNFGTTVFLFRKDVMEYYGINEQEVFDKALKLYSNSLALDPNNFLLATDIAMTFYGIKPPRVEDALKAWNYALQLAEGSLQREGVFIHLARIKMNDGRLADAREHLNSVTNAELADLKARVMRNLEAKENPISESETNATPESGTNALPELHSTTNSVPSAP